MHGFFILESVNGWWLHSLVIVNRVTMNMAEQGCLRYAELVYSNGMCGLYCILSLLSEKASH